MFWINILWWSKQSNWSRTDKMVQVTVEVPVFLSELKTLWCADRGSDWDYSAWPRLGNEILSFIEGWPYLRG